MLSVTHAGERQEDGRYPEDSANYLVDKQLQELATKLKEFGKKEEGGRTEDKA